MFTYAMSRFSVQRHLVVHSFSTASEFRDFKKIVAIVAHIPNRDLQYLVNHLALILKPLRPTLKLSLAPLPTSEDPGFKCSLFEFVQRRVVPFVFVFLPSGSVKDLMS